MTKQQIYKDMYFLMLARVRCTPKDQIGEELLKIFRQAQSILANMEYKNETKRNA